MSSPPVRGLWARGPWHVGLLVLFLLLTALAVPFLSDETPLLGRAAGAELQKEPTLCAAIGANWTACGNASVSDDVYAAANSTDVSFVRAGGATGTSFAFDIGSPGTDRLVVVIADDESTGTSLTDVTVDSTSCNRVTVADNPAGAGNHQEMWYCDEDDLGASSGLVTVAIVGGDFGWALHAHLYTGVSQAGPTDTEIEDTAFAVATIEVEFVTVPAGGLVVFGAGHGSAGSFVGWTSPLLERTDGPDAASTTFGSASEVESASQTDKTYIATASGSFNRGTGIVAVWPSGIGNNDTAWFGFGLDLGPQDIVNLVEVGVEWYRLNASSILNVTVSWDGGSTWAPNQTATNKSVDDDTVEFLNFTSATAWDPTRLNDANLRVRVGTNHSGARLDFLTVRVNYNLPAVNLTLVSSSPTADPGDVLTLNATVENLGPGTAHNFLLEASVDPNATYLASAPVGTYDAGMRTVQWTLSLLSPGQRGSFEWTVRVNPGLPDLASVNTSFRVTYENVTGSSLPPRIATAQTTVQVPVFDPVLRLDRSEAERGDVALAILYYNNTGSGQALNAWANWTLNDHFALMDIFPAQTYSGSAQGFDISFTDLAPGSHSLVARLRVIRGLEDGLAMELRLAWSATDGNGNPLASAARSGAVSLLAPSLTVVLGSSGTSVQVGSEFTLDATVLNVGQGVGEGWLNLTLPPGVLYVASIGPLEVTAAAGLVSWEIASLDPGAQVQVEVRLRAESGPSLESFVLSVEFTDGKGSSPLTVFSDEVFVRLLGTGSAPLPWWIFLLPLLIPAAFLGFYLNRRLRHPELRIEEVFVIHRKGILVAHQSRTLTPDRDRDILAAMFKVVQGFVQNAFSADAEGTMRGLRFENFNILIEQGTHHYVAVVYRGRESRILERRVAELSQSIEAEFGALLAAWVGDMDEIRGIQRLLPVIWGESAAFGVGGGPAPVAGATRAVPAGTPQVVYESLPGKLASWLPLPYRGARRLLQLTSSQLKDLIQARRGVLIRMRYKARLALERLLGLVRANERRRRFTPPS